MTSRSKAPLDYLETRLADAQSVLQRLLYPTIKAGLLNSHTHHLVQDAEGLVTRALAEVQSLVVIRNNERAAAHVETHTGMRTKR